jgi:hypothetical protein
MRWDGKKHGTWFKNEHGKHKDWLGQDLEEQAQRGFVVSLLRLISDTCYRGAYIAFFLFFCT